MFIPSHVAAFPARPAGTLAYIMALFPALKCRAILCRPRLRGLVCCLLSSFTSTYVLRFSLTSYGLCSVSGNLKGGPPTSNHIRCQFRSQYAKPRFLTGLFQGRRQQRPGPVRRPVRRLVRRPVRWNILLASVRVHHHFYIAFPGWRRVCWCSTRSTSPAFCP